MTPHRIDELYRAHRDGLLLDTVPFWVEGCEGYFNRTHGGYRHMVDRDSSLIDTDKGVSVQGRNAWLWATLYNTVEESDASLEAAELGIRFLDAHCFESANARMWFHVEDGTPVRKHRYAFSESFAAIAYARGRRGRAGPRTPKRRSHASTPSGGKCNDAHLVNLGCRMLHYMWVRGWDQEHRGRRSSPR